MACVGDSISPPNLPVQVLLILCFCFISNLLKTQHLPSLKLAAKASENGWLEDELSFPFGAKSLLRGKLTVSFREDPLVFFNPTWPTYTSPVHDGPGPQTPRPLEVTRSQHLRHLGPGWNSRDGTKQGGNPNPELEQFYDVLLHHVVILDIEFILLINI